MSDGYRRKLESGHTKRKERESKEEKFFFRRPQIFPRPWAQCLVCLLDNPALFFILRATHRFKDHVRIEMWVIVIIMKLRFSFLYPEWHPAMWARHNTFAQKWAQY